MDGKGLLGYFNLRIWFDSLSKDIQDKIFRYYTNNTTDPRNLVEGEGWRSSNTAVKLLCNLSLNALGNKDYELCDLLIKKAEEVDKEKEDALYYDAILKRIEEEKKYISDQRTVDIYKEKVLSIIRESPGILQSNITTLFDSSEEVPVGHALSQIKYEGKIRREKSGRSFKLYLNNFLKPK